MTPYSYFSLFFLIILKLGIYVRIKYFENTLRPEPEGDDEDNSHWKPIIDIKSFREACFNGKIFKNKKKERKLFLFSFL